jgi:predicted acetyltransferase
LDRHVPAFQAPDVNVHQSFLAAMAEFQAEGRGAPDDDSMVGGEIRTWSGRWADPAVFAEYTAWLRADSLEESPRRDGFVPCTNLWWTDGDEYIGRLAIRHRLTPWLREQGGHIGYDVRPAARRRGHATAMLAAALPIARALGIDRVLVTCDADNVGSQRTIEKNGGAFEDQRANKLRYWIPTDSGRESGLK